MARKRKLEDSEDPANRGGHGTSDCPNLEVPTGRRKKSTSSRIGRACDRCQHRKLACDADPAGCQPCQKVESWCTVTDPLTNTPTYRGEFEYLERKVAKQSKDIQDLLARLRELGEDVSFFHGNGEEESEEDRRYLAWTRLKATGDTKPWDRDERITNGSRNSGSQLYQNGGSNNVGGDSFARSATDTKYNHGPVEDDSITVPVPSTTSGRKYAGLSNNDGDTKIKLSTRLNLLGWELDIAAYIDDADDDFDALPSPTSPLYDRSYRSFIATAFGQQPKIQNVSRPTRQEAFDYANVYLGTQGPFVPIFHKPTLFELLTRFYDDSSFRPSPAEGVCLYMLFATTLDQLARRNSRDGKLQLNYTNQSHQYYHYSIANFSKLMIGNTLEDMQALAMICIHTRHFPRPEVGWMVMSMTFNRLIQLDYHRTASAGESWVAQKSFLEIEIRKRVFWTVLTVLVTASGKLGRPMPIRCEDFDVEIPRAIADEKLLEARLDKSGLDESDSTSCDFLVALEAFKVEPIYMELYNSLYAAERAPKDYEGFVSQAEDRIQRWTEQWHPKFRSTSSNDPIIIISMQYLRSWSLEYRLLLYHPSLSLAKSVEFNDASLKKCLRVAEEWLQLLMVIQEYKALDTTWYNCAVYILAMQTTIFGHFHLEGELTQARVDQLRRDVDAWLSIIGDIGDLLGSGIRLRNELHKDVQSRLDRLQQNVTKKMRTIKSEADSPSHKTTLASNLVSNVPTAERRATDVDRSGYGTFNQPRQDSSSYIAQTKYDPEAGGSSLSRYLPAEHYPYANSDRTQFPGSMPSPYAPPAQLGMVNQLLPSSTTTGYVPSQGGSNNPGMYMSNADGFGLAGVYGPDPASWYHYTQMSPTNIENPEYHVDTLVQLSGRSGDHMARDESGINFDAAAASSGSQIWPRVLLDPQGNGS